MTLHPISEPDEPDGEPAEALSPPSDEQPCLDVEAEAALEELYEELAGGLYAYFRSRGVEPEPAKDLVHETFLNIGRYIRSGRTIKSPKAFVLRVAHNVWVDWLRKPERRSVPVGDALQDEPDSQTEDDIDVAIDRLDRRDSIAALAAAIGELQPREREIVTMHYFAALSDAEIAEILGVAQGTVRAALSTARRKLRGLLRRWGYGEEGEDQ